jgi:hypothetical protein
MNKNASFVHAINANRRPSRAPGNAPVKRRYISNTYYLFLSARTIQIPKCNIFILAASTQRNHTLLRATTYNLAFNANTFTPLTAAFFTLYLNVSSDFVVVRILARTTFRLN